MLQIYLLFSSKSLFCRAFPGVHGSGAARAAILFDEGIVFEYFYALVRPIGPNMTGFGKEVLISSILTYRFAQIGTKVR